MRGLMLVPVLAVTALPADALQVQQVQQVQRVEARAADERAKPPQAILYSRDELRALRMEIEKLIERNKNSEALLLRELESKGDPRRIQALQDEMELAGHDLLRKQSRFVAACVELKRRTGPFTGWIGVTFEREVLFRKEDGPLGTRVTVRFDGTPRIAKVEPGSPAEAAGVQIGDEWRALNGRVIIDSVEFSELDQPGATVAIRTMRVGREHQNHLVVGTNPPFPEEVCGGATRMVEFASPWIVRSQSVPGSVLGARIDVGVRPNTALPKMLVITSTANSIWFGGATLRSLKDSEREFLKIRDGVLVADVVEGAPASAAGLMSFDVVVTANGTVVASLADFRRAMLSQPTLTLTVQREGKTRVVKIPAK